ncbi:hypothetical protein [Microbispora sp. KK1-11]|uniref:hypothetical protein n=1 Tax=Microbispora sp. KK1-11 TaxID=2053005 RepID=UPI001158388C|nr:hypothetical protein [Microbispora sp. KK1-11]TQS29156.1 hypothetical protein FLW16_12505 [Microbispora sp. KK1-11]
MISTDRDSMLDIQHAAALVLADLLTRDLPSASWTVCNVYDSLDGQISSWSSSKDDRIAMIRRWADTFGVEPTVQHAGTKAENLRVVFRHQGVEVQVWTCIADPAEPASGEA